jgi:hypothetical protein
MSFATFSTCRTYRKSVRNGGHTRSTLSLSRTVIQPPAADTIVAICQALGIEPEDLLALTGKIPSTVHRTVSGSATAQQFLHEAQQVALTDQEWIYLLHALRRLRIDL